MKYFKTKFIILISVLALISGCSHTNELMRYDITGTKILFKKYSVPGYANVNVFLNDEVNDNSKYPYVVLIKIFGEEKIKSDVREKLKKAINPDSIVTSISNSIKDEMITYYGIIPVDSVSDNPQFVCETRFEKFSLNSGSYGVTAEIKSRVTITQRPTGKIVWENTEHQHLPVYDIMISYAGGKLSRTVGSVVNAVRLSNMTEEEIRESIRNAAAETGKEQCRTLREDISETK